MAEINVTFTEAEAEAIAGGAPSVELAAAKAKVYAALGYDDAEHAAGYHVAPHPRVEGRIVRWPVAARRA